MNPGIYLFIIVGGVLQAMGSAMNAQLYKSLVNPWLASLVSFSLIACFFAVLHKPLPRMEQVIQMPWWAPLAGVIGAADTLLALPWTEAVARPEKALLTRALRAADGNRTEAARRPEIHRQLLYARLKEHGLGDDPAGNAG